MKVGFIQHFSMGDNGGGSKILRSLLPGQTFEWRSICTQPRRPRIVQFSGGDEIWLPARPSTRLDNTRLAWLSNKLGPFFAQRLRKSVHAILEREKFDAVHIIPHGPDDWLYAAEYCLANGTPLLMSVHDDIRYTFSREVYKKRAAAFAGVWQKASHVFCISEELGKEYCSRYGTREFEVLTDGIEIANMRTRPPRPGKLHVYFCGLVHHAYIRNFDSLFEALESLKADLDAKLVLRGGVMFRELQRYEPLTERLPFAENIGADFELVDVLYLPLPFGGQYKDFVQFSMSTKLITYLASGVPILYHGPEDSALCKLLESSGAARLVTSERASDLREALIEFALPGAQEFVIQAQALAKDCFSLPRLRHALHSTIRRVCSKEGCHVVA